MLDEARTAVFSMSMDSAKKKEMEDFFENLGLTLRVEEKADISGAWGASCSGQPQGLF